MADHHLPDAEAWETTHLRLRYEEEPIGSARIKVIGVGGLADHVNSPTFATGVGLVLYGYRNSTGYSSRVPVGAGAFVRVAGRLRGLFREFF